jgi:hypothetical protein
MRLFEVDNSAVDNLVTALKQLIGTSDDIHAPQLLSYPALSNILRNMGYPEVNQETFKQLWDKNDELQAVVNDPAETDDNIVLKTSDQRTQQELGKSAGPDIDAMAKSGAQDFQSKLS